MLSTLAPRQVAAVQVSPTVPGASYSTVINETPGMALSTVDQQAMQQDASANNLELFLANTELVLGKSANAERYAAMLVGDHRDAGYALQDLANMKHVMLPADIKPQDAAVALQVLSAASTTGFDQAFLNAMEQSHTTALSNVQKQITTVTDPQFKSFLQSVLPIYQGHLSEAQSLLANGTFTAPGRGTAPTGSTSLAQGDAQNLQTAYAISNLDMYLSQLAALVGQSQGVGAGNPSGTASGSATSLNLTDYAEKLVSDHAKDNHELEGIALATNTPLTAGVAPADYSKAQTVLATLTPSGTAGSGGQGLSTSSFTGFENAYLSQMVQSHVQAISTNQQALNTVQDPSLNEFARFDIATDQLHLQGARTLQAGLSTGAGGGNGSGNTLTVNSPAAAYVLSLYESLLNRAPSQAELNAWVYRLRHGASTTAVYNSIANSAERKTLLGFGNTGVTTTSRYQNLKNYVDTLYTSVLGRQADPAGEAYWINILARGVNQNAVAQAFYKSAEYNQMWGRHFANIGLLRSPRDSR
ncbi:MAG: DUF4142 domain-containing protein [Planctomycetia bacterium]|nr:DUF4142 domain-containing protein [Planctomycetia bacterium]